MRRLIFILCAMIGVSQAQTIQYIGAPTTTVISRGNFRTDSIFYLPKRTKLPTDTAALRYQISDSSLYAWTGSQWRKVGADPDSLIFSTRAWRQKGDDSLAARINLKVNISDTAAMLAPYLRKADTTAMLSPYFRKADTATLSNRINLKLNISDTATMLSPYYRSATATAALATKLNISDTATMLSPYYRSATATSALATKLNISDTSSMLTPYVRHAGYGLTKSGQSFLVDTLNIATRAWRQKGIDSVAGLSRVGGSGTTNTVAKFTASGTIGNSTIFDNGTTISTSTPIQINPTSAGSSYQQFKYSGTDVALLGTDASISGGSASDFGIYTYGANNMDLWTNNARRLRIFANGRIGVNTTTDAGYQFDVNGDVRFQGTLYTRSGTNTGIVMANTSAIRNTGTQYFDYGTGGSGDFYFRGGSGFADILTLMNGGNVGISTTSPSYKLDVNGTLRSVNGANFATTSGNVGIGTASPAYKLDVAFSSGGDIIRGSYTGGTKSPFLAMQANDDALMFFASGNSDNTSQMGFKVNGTEAGRINANREFLLNASGTDAGDYKLQVSGNIYNTGSAVLAATGGEVLVGTTTDRGAYKLQADGLSFFGSDANSYALLNNTASNAAIQAYGAWTNHLRMTYPAVVDFDMQVTASGELDIKRSSTVATRVNAAREFMINTTTDAGDYHLQVVGNARVGTGKLDIASNTTFGLGVARSGTSEIAQQVFNSNGILYLGAESSAGGQIFSGSSAYAGVIGTGANYPLQFGANNITRATLTTGGNFMIGFPTDTYFYRLQVNGSIFSNNQIIAQNTAAQLNIDSSTNISPLYISNQSLTGSSAQGLFYGSTTWNTTGNPSLIDLAITNTASGSDANYIKISDGSNIFRVTKAAEVVTAAPTGGSIRKWKLGEAATVSPTSPNRTIRVEIDGTVYYLHAKTTND